MAEFAYNNAKNTSTNYISFELNCGYHLQVFYKKDVNLCFQSKLVDKLATKLRELIIICKKNLQHIQEFQKQYYDKYTKPKSCAPGKEVWLNSKYIKIKQNCKLEAKFFGSFKVLYLIRKRAYKLELPKK